MNTGGRHHISDLKPALLAWPTSKAAAWYRRVFDMMILEQRVPETVHMVLGHSHLILQAKSGQSEYRAGAQPSLLFKVEAVHAIVARCRSLGATIVRGPEKNRAAGGRRLWPTMTTISSRWIRTSPIKQRRE